MSPQEKRVVASINCNCLYGQGYFNRAEKAVRKALAISSNILCKSDSKEELWKHRELWGQKAFIRILTSSKVDMALTLRKELMESMGVLEFSQHSFLHSLLVRSNLYEGLNSRRLISKQFISESSNLRLAISSDARERLTKRSPLLFLA